jgi:hypothetical protein
VSCKIFAYKRIIKENGLMNIPNNSIGANIIRIGLGTWHPENMYMFVCGKVCD